MSFELSEVPSDRCDYIRDSENPGVCQASCSYEWLVVQEGFKFCTFCGHPIHKLQVPDDPPKARRTA